MSACRSTRRAGALEEDAGVEIVPSGRGIARTDGMPGRVRESWTGWTGVQRVSDEKGSRRSGRQAVSARSRVDPGRRVDLYLDARMGAEVGKVLAVRPQDPTDCRAYEGDLYQSTEAFRAPCTARSTIYYASGLSAFIAATVGNHLAGRRYRRELVVDFRQGLIV